MLFTVVDGNVEDYLRSDHVEYVILESSKVNQRLSVLHKIESLQPFTARILQQLQVDRRYVTSDAYNMSNLRQKLIKFRQC